MVLQIRIVDLPRRSPPCHIGRNSGPSRGMTGNPQPSLLPQLGLCAGVRSRHASLMKILGVVLILSGALILSGCALGAGNQLPAEDLVVSTISSNSTPGFVSEPQRVDDVVDEIDVTSAGVDLGSIRFQGEWGGKEIFLGVSGENTVNLIVGADSEPTEWGTGKSIGNSVIGTNTDWADKTGRTTVQYIPQGTQNVPEGWFALSNWIIVRK